MTFLVTVTALCAAIIAIGGAIAMLHKIPYVRKHWEAYRAAQASTRRQDLREIVKPLLLELSPNHGSSMRDVVDRIEARQIEDHRRLAVLTAEHRELKIRLGFDDAR